jgi:hypothetical protein
MEHWHHAAIFGAWVKKAWETRVSVAFQEDTGRPVHALASLTNQLHILNHDSRRLTEKKHF